MERRRFFASGPAPPRFSQGSIAQHEESGSKTNWDGQTMQVSRENRPRRSQRHRSYAGLDGLDCSVANQDGGWLFEVRWLPSRLGQRKRIQGRTDMDRAIPRTKANKWRQMRIFPFRPVALLSLGTVLSATRSIADNNATGRNDTRLSLWLKPELVTSLPVAKRTRISPPLSPLPPPTVAVSTPTASKSDTDMA
ncbi:hypothetical protein CLAIMM_00170, partial [Cladophialophora immunda]